MATRRVERIDHAEELSAPRETPEGFLVVEAFVSRPGIYRYINTREDEADGLGPIGTVRLELRPDSEVFSEKSAATYRARSITVGHPRKGGKRVRVDAANVREFEVGTVDGGARRVGDKLAATLVIKDKAAIADAKAGKRQLSPGHFIDLIVEKGVDPKYGRYDCIQTGIDINHLALVEKARGGDSLQMRLDDGEELRTDDRPGKLTTAVTGHQHLVSATDWDGKTCSSGTTSWALAEGDDIGHEHAWVKNPDGTITIAESGGHTHALLEVEEYATTPLAPLRSDEGDMSDEKTEIEKLRATNETLMKRISELEQQGKLRLDAAETEAVKAAVLRADTAEQKLAQVMGARSKDIQARVQLQRVAEQFMGDHYRCDGKGDDDIKRDVVRRLDSSLDVTSMPSSRLDGHFEALVRLHQKSREDYAQISETLGGGTRVDHEASAKKVDDQWNNQWKRPPASSQMLKKEV